MTGDQRKPNPGEDDVLAMLRAARSGAEPAMPDVTAPAIVAGRRIRRRRQALGALSGVVLAGAATLALIAGSPSMGISDRLVVLPPAGPAATSVPAPEPSSTYRPKPDGMSEADYQAAIARAEADKANNRLTVEILGPDFRIGPNADVPRLEEVQLDPASPAAQNLPPGYRVRISGGVPLDTRGLMERCQPQVEKGLHVGPCTQDVLGDGRVVYVRQSRSVLGEYVPTGDRSPPGAGDGTAVFFERTDGSIVEASMSVSDPRETASVARQKTAVAWLIGYEDELVRFVTHEEVRPGVRDVLTAPTDPETVTDPTQEELNQSYLREALGSSFSLINGEVTLEPGSAATADLPQSYTAGASASFLKNQNTLSKACTLYRDDAPNGDACERRALPGGGEVLVRSFAGYLDSDSLILAHTRVFYVQPDGDIVRVDLNVRGAEVAKSDSAAPQAQVEKWLRGFEDELIKAATDPRMAR